MARRHTGQEIFTVVTDPITHRGFLDGLSGLTNRSLLGRRLADIYAAPNSEPSWPLLVLFRALQVRLAAVAYYLKRTAAILILEAA